MESEAAGTDFRVAFKGTDHVPALKIKDTKLLENLKAHFRR